MPRIPVWKCLWNGVQNIILRVRDPEQCIGVTFFISFDYALQSKKVPFEIGHKILKSKVLVIIYRVIIVDKMNSSITTEEAKATDIEELLKTLSTSKEGLSTSEAFLDYIRTAAVKRGSRILAGVQSGQCY